MTRTKVAGMRMKGVSSGGPASSSSTERPASASRLATTQPALPPPITM